MPDHAHAKAALHRPLAQPSGRALHHDADGAANGEIRALIRESVCEAGAALEKRFSDGG